MADAPSKRLRFRIFAEDDQCLEEALKTTSHTSKSDVIRAALGFLDQAWAGRNSGFRVMFRAPATGEMIGALDAIAPRVPHRGGDAESPGRRAKTDKSIEIRVTRGDEERIHRLIKSGAADTYSELIRRSLRLYMAAVQRSQAGYEVVALSPSGDLLPVNVSGMGAAAYPAPGGQARVAMPVAVGTASLLGLLPRTLAVDVARLAAMEQCSPDMLVVDLVRAESFARLNPETRRVEAPVETQPATDEHAEAVLEAGRTLEQMADSIEKIMQIIGVTARTKSQQAQFSDLLFSASSVEEQPTESLSDIEHLSLRAQELNERLTTLLSLTQREPKQRKSRTPKNAADTESA